MQTINSQLLYALSVIELILVVSFVAMIYAGKQFEKQQDFGYYHHEAYKAYKIASLLGAILIANFALILRVSHG